MAKVDGAKVFEQLRLKERTLDSLNRDEMLAVKSYSKFARQKTFSAEKPLAATKEGQAQLKKAASVPKPKAPKAPPAEKVYKPTVKEEKTWGTQLAEAFPGAVAAAQKAGQLAMSIPSVNAAVSAFGAPASAAVDFVAEALDPTSTKTFGQTFAEQQKVVQKAAQDYLKKEGVESPLDAYKLFTPNAFNRYVSQTSQALSQSARPPLDVTKGIFEQSAIKFGGLTPEQAKQASVNWVAQNPNLAGTSSNILGAAIDPLNLPIVGGISKLGKVLGKSAPVPKPEPSAPQAQAQPRPQAQPQPQAPVQQAPEGEAFLPEGQLIPEIERTFGVRRQYPKPITQRGAQPAPAVTPEPQPVAPRIAEDLAPPAAVVPEPPAVQPKPAVEAPKPKPVTQAPTPTPKPTAPVRLGEDLQPTQFVIPKDLKGSKPRYNYGEKPFTLEFDSDLDKALYIVAKATKSKADDKFMDILVKYTGMKPDEIRALGMQVRERIKQMAKDAEPGVLRLSDTGIGQPKPKQVPTQLGEDLAPTQPKPAVATQPKPKAPKRDIVAEVDANGFADVDFTPKAAEAFTKKNPDYDVKLSLDKDGQPIYRVTKKQPAVAQAPELTPEPPVAVKLGEDLAPEQPVQAPPPPPVKKGGRPKKQPDAATTPSPTPTATAPTPKPPKKGGVPKNQPQPVAQTQPQPVKKGKPPKVKPTPPETPFVGNERFAASANVPTEVSDILKGWIDMLGLDNRIYITTADEAAVQPFTNDIFKKQTLKDTTEGVARRYPRSDTDAIIIYRPNQSMVKNLETISHELGHILMTAKYETALPHVRKAIDDEYNKWLLSVKGGTARQLIDKLRSYKSALANKLPATKLARELKPYWRSKDEWFADQVARWATTTEKPLTVVEKFFSRLAKVMKQFFEKNKEWLPSKTMKDWLDGLKKTAATSPNTRPLINIVEESEMRTLPQTTRDVGDTTLKSQDADVEDVLTATADRSFRFKEKAKEVLDNLEDMFLKFKPMGQISKFYRDMKGKSPANIIREAFYEGQRKVARSADAAERDLRNVFKTIKTKEDKELFTRFVVLRDALQTIRVDALADLPKGVSEAQVLKELKEITAKMRGNQDVIDAVKTYDTVMKKVFDDLVRRGVLKPESRRVGYYPHQVLKYATDVKMEQQLKLDTPSRGYSLRRKGSIDPYDTDFEEVVRRTLTKVYSDNAIQETLGKVLRFSDALNDISAQSVSLKDGGKLLQEAQQAAVKTPEYKTWKANKVQELMDGGMNQRDAEKQAWAIWRKDVPKSTKDKFFMSKFKEYAKSGMSKQSLVAKINKEWQDYKDQPRLVMERVNDGTVITSNGKNYKLFKPRFKEEIYLVPEAVYDEIKDFGTPIYKDNEYILLAFGKFTSFFKTSALTITAPARIVVDAMSNAVKLGIMDTAALFELPRALRIVLSEADSPLANKIAGYLKKITVEKRAEVLDEYTRRFLVRHEIIEPAAITKGVYQFTPAFEKTLRYAGNISGVSRNLTQRVDEIFRAAKVSRDLKRVISGEFAKADGIVDVEGLSKLGQVSKIGHEFTVNSMRQSKYMRRYYTQLAFPFLNWPAIDTLHLLRFAKNRPIKAGLYLGAIVAGFEAWNNTGERRKVEEMLPPEKRQVPHLITGFTGKEDKPIIFYFPIIPGLTAMQATGLAKVPQNLTDALVTSTIPGKEKKKASEIFENPITPLAKTATGMANPFLRTAGELRFNKSLFTDRPIVKESEKGTNAELTQQLKYALEQTAPPYRAFTSSIKESEKMMMEDNEAKRTETLADALGKFFNPIKRIRKEEDMRKLAEAKGYSLVQQRTLEEKNPAYQKLRELYPKALNSGDFTKVATVIREAQLGEREVEAFFRSNYLALVKDALAQTTDPKKRAAYQEQIEGLVGKKGVENVRRAGVGNVEESMYYYKMQQEGVK